MEPIQPQRVNVEMLRSILYASDQNVSEHQEAPRQEKIKMIRVHLIFFSVSSLPRTPTPLRPGDFSEVPQLKLDAANSSLDPFSGSTTSHQGCLMRNLLLKEKEDKERPKERKKEGNQTKKTWSIGSEKKKYIKKCPHKE